MIYSQDPNQTSIAEMIKARLIDKFGPDHLVVADVSERHRGHAGYPQGGQSHFRVEIISERFRGLGRVARQRLVYQELDDLMQTQVHALAISAAPPDTEGPTRVADKDPSKVG